MEKAATEDAGRLRQQCFGRASSNRLLGLFVVLVGAGCLVQFQILWVASYSSSSYLIRSASSQQRHVFEQSLEWRRLLPSSVLVTPNNKYENDESKMVAVVSASSSSSEQYHDGNSRPMHYWPPLNELVGRRNGSEVITGDVRHLLDFVIVGHPKTGTTSLMRWLGSHPGIMIDSREIQSNLKIGRPVYLVKQLHRKYSPERWRRRRRELLMSEANRTEEQEEGNSILRGYKAPNEIHFRTGLRVLAHYWPDAKLIVGVRHPVSYFNSWYNFKVNNGVSMPSPDAYNSGQVDLPPMMRFHENLSLLGKTALDENERILLGPPRRAMTPQEEGDILRWSGLDPLDWSPVPNKVFLYEAAQADDDDARPKDGGNPGDGRKSSTSFRSELSAFLGVSLIADQPKENEQTRRTFDVCQARFAPLRQRLARLGSEMSEWILTYFVRHPDVVVCGPPGRFEELVRSWSKDPCDEKNGEAEAASAAERE